MMTKVELLHNIFVLCSFFLTLITLSTYNVWFFRNICLYLIEGIFTIMDEFSDLKVKLRRVCVLDVDESDDSTTSMTEAQEVDDNYFPHNAGDVLKALDPSISVEICLLSCNARQAIASIRQRQHNTDLFINTYDVSDDTGLKVIEYMENQGLPFTGAGARFFDPTRMELKTVCRSNEILTPSFAFVHDLETIKQVLSELGEFPLFVKPEHGNGSSGIDEQSVVYNMTELKIRVKEIIKQFGGALVEQYIDGREFSVLVVGSNYTGIAAPQPIELKFSATGPAFLTYEEKWHGNYHSWCLIDENEASLRQELMDMSIKLYKAFNGEGSARFDIRQDARTKKLYMLDINPNPSCSVDTILHLTGWGKLKYLKLLIDHAFERQKRFHSVHGYLIKYSKSKSFGLYAAHDLKRGNLVYSDEERSLRLVSYQYAIENWSEQKMRNFHSYAWPMGPDIYAVWDLDSSNSKSFNHSCDPNVWMNGLQFITRRYIACGEELTIDYATVFPSHPYFHCSCGTSECRTTIQPNEYREQWFRKRYGTYVSPYVQMLMEIDEAKKNMQEVHQNSKDQQSYQNE